MKKYLLLLAMALPMFMTTACHDDENETEPDMGEQTHFTDGKEYLESMLFYHDEAGKVTGLVLGEFVMENEPTTAYVSVESQEKAQRLASSLFPPNTGVKMADNITFTLIDSLGVEQGKARYTASNTGESYGRLTFDDALGIDKKLLTSIVFIDDALWPANAPIGRGDLQVECIYTCSKKIPIEKADKSFRYFEPNFVCTRVPSGGQPGILFADLGYDTYQLYFLDSFESGIERRITQYPSSYWMEELASDLNGGNTIFYQEIAAGSNTTVKNIKSRWYFTHHVNGRNMTVCTLGEWATNIEVVPIFDEHYYNGSLLYKFTVDANGKTEIKLDGAGCWKERQTEISLSDLRKNTNLMLEALKKNPNE